jgi:NitT/TauT family transport system substrate-binding protein
MRNRHKPALILILLIALSIALAFSSFFTRQQQEKETPKIETVKIMEDGHSLLYLPQYIALRKGFFDEEKLQVEIITATTRGTMLNALADRRSEILLTGLEYAIYARAEGKGNLIAFAALAKKDGALLVSREKDQAFQWDSLKYKTIITGPPSERKTVLLKKTLIKYGLAPNHQVTLFTNIPASLQKGAFQSGTGDYILLDEPDASRLEASTPGKIVVFLGQETGELPAAVYLANSDYIKNHPEIVERLTGAIHKALLWLNQHNTGEIVRAIRPYYKNIDASLLNKAVDCYRLQNTWTTNTAIEPAEYDCLLELLIEAREISEPIPYKKMVDKRFAPI